MKKWIVLFSIGIGLLLANLDMTIVNLALPEFSREFGASMTQIQLIIVSYLTAAAALFCLFGKLADSIGRKRVFLVGSVLFMLSSLYMGAFAGTVGEIIVARFVQGAGFAATLGLALILIANAFPPERKGFATGVAVTITGIGMALGPPAGGFILQYLGWRSIFLLNVPLGLLSIALTWFFVDREPDGSKQPMRLDFLGIPFYFAGLGCLIYLSNMLGSTSLSTALLIVAAGGLSLAVFVVRSLKVEHPLINVALLTNIRYLTVIVIRMIFNYTMASFLFVLPLFMQNVLGFSKLKSGLWLLCMTISVAFVAPFAGKVIDRVGFRLPTLVSMGLLLVSCISFSLLGPGISTALLVVGLLCFGLSNGMLTTATINGVTTQVSPNQAGTAIGLFFTLVMVGSMFGVSLSGLLIDRTSHAELTARADRLGTLVTPAQQSELFAVANGSRSLTQAALPESTRQAAAVQEAVRASYFSALHTLMLFNTALNAVGVLLCISLFRKQQDQQTGALHAVKAS